MAEELEYFYLHFDWILFSVVQTSALNDVCCVEDILSYFCLIQDANTTDRVYDHLYTRLF